MKKVLLTLAAVAMAFTVGAAETTLEVKDATDIKGTLNEEKAAGEGGSQYGEAKNYKPLESLKMGEYSFTFAMTESESAPAYYFPMSTNEKGEYTIRLYGGKDKVAGNKMTVTCPDGKTMKSLSLTCVKATANATVDASVGIAATPSAKEVVWSSDEAVSEVTLTFHEQSRFTAITISDEAGSVTPPVTGDVAVKKATAFEAGEVAFVFNEGYVETFSSDKTYGYWIAVATTPADEMKVSNEAIFTIESTDKGYTIKDSFGRFMGWNGKNWSFNAYTSADEGNSYWDAAMVDGKVKITNKAQSSDGNEVYLCGKTYNSDYEMVPTDRADQTLPMLYVKGGEGSVAGIVADNAPAVYYNLQGVRVENPTKGLYIVVKGNKSTKVVF